MQLPKRRKADQDDDDDDDFLAPLNSGGFRRLVRAKRSATCEGGEHDPPTPEAARRSDDACLVGEPSSDKKAKLSARAVGKDGTRYEQQQNEIIDAEAVWAEAEHIIAMVTTSDMLHMPRAATVNGVDSKLGRRLKASSVEAMITPISDDPSYTSSAAEGREIVARLRTL